MTDEKNILLPSPIIDAKEDDSIKKLCERYEKLITPGMLAKACLLYTSHIARGRESSCMIKIAEQTIQVRDKYHWLRADFKLNSRNRSGKLRR